MKASTQRQILIVVIAVDHTDRAFAHAADGTR